jgi:DNA replication protein DnaC
MNDKSENRTCWDCQGDFPWAPTTSYQSAPRLCPQCTEKAIAANLRQARAKLREAITECTPARFQATDCTHPDFRQSLWQRVKRWRPTAERPWLGLIGPTGACKTRVGFMVFHEAALDMIRAGPTPDIMPRCPSVAAVSAYQLAQAVSELAGDAKKTAADFLQRMARVRILLIDDLGKQRNTQATANHMFAILDSRHAENLCTIWTSNLSPQEIVAGMPEDMAAPLAGRIMECSTIISTE